jgi:hypothetical protein
MNNTCKHHDLIRKMGLGTFASQIPQADDGEPYFFIGFTPLCLFDQIIYSLKLV